MMHSIKIPYRFRVSILLYFLTLITYLDRITISLVGVRIKAAFHLSNTQFGYVLGAFALAYALFEIPSALLGDRIGQRKVFLRIVLWWSLFTALTGAVNGFISLLLVRFFFGIGESGSYPNATGVISRWFPKTETTRGFSWLSMGSGSGSALAPLIVVPVAVAFGWRAPFFVNAFIGIVWLCVCFMWFRNHPSEMNQISQKEKEYIESNRCFVERHQPFPWRLASKNLMLWALIIAFFCSQWANYFFIAWMPNYLQEGKHFSEQEMKTTTSLLFIFGIIASFICGYWSDWLILKKGPRFARRFTAIGCFGLMDVLILISAQSSNHFVIKVSLIAAHFLLLPYIITCYSTCISISGNRATTVAGIMNFFGQMGAFFMSIIFGKIIDLTHSFESPQYVMICVLVIGALCWFAIDSSKKLIVD